MNILAAVLFMIFVHGTNIFSTSETNFYHYISHWKSIKQFLFWTNRRQTIFCVQNQQNIFFYKFLLKSIPPHTHTRPPPPDR